jgi:phospholipase C
MLGNARDRRRAGRVACATGALALTGALGALASVPGAAGASVPPSPIQHIVVLYLENHSFDSLFGFWCDRHPRRCPQGGMPATVQLSKVMNGPEWNSTVLFVTWDDCGCFYDQVPPPHDPSGRQEGPRLPLVIVSPYARHGYTDTTPATYAGVLAYVEQTFGLARLGINDAQAYPFTNSFNYSQAPLRPVRMVTRPVPRGDHIIWSQAKEDT